MDLRRSRALIRRPSGAAIANVSKLPASVVGMMALDALYCPSMRFSGAAR